MDSLIAEPRLSPDLEQRRRNDRMKDRITKLSFRGEALQKYRTGDAFNLDGIKIIASYSMGPDKEVTEDCTYSIDVGDILTCSSPTGEEQKEVIVRYSEYDNEHNYPLGTVGTSFKIVIYDTLSSITILRRVESKYFVNETVPVTGIKLLFENSKEYTITGIDFVEPKRLSLGQNNVVATYIHDGDTKTASFSVDAVEPSYGSMSLIPSAITPVYAGDRWNFDKLSVSLYREDFGRPGISETASMETLKYDSSRLSVDKETINSYSDRTVTVSLIENPSISGSMTLRWKARISAIEVEVADTWGDFWNNTAVSNMAGWSINSLMFDDGTISIIGDVLSSNQREYLEIRGESGAWETSKITVPYGRLSSETDARICLETRYDDGKTLTNYYIQRVKAFSRVDSMQILNNPKMDYYEFERFNPDGMDVQANFDSGVEKNVTDEIEFSEDELTFNNEDSVQFQLSYTLAPSNKLNRQISFATLNLMVAMRNLTAVDMVSPTGVYGGFKVGDVANADPIVLTLHFADGYVKENYSLQNITQTQYEGYELLMADPEDPQRMVAISSFETPGNYDLTVRYHRGADQETTFDLPYHLSVDYYETGNRLEIRSFPNTAFFEGATFNPENIQAVMVFGNGFELDVSDALECSADGETYQHSITIQRNQSKIYMRYILHAIRGDEEYVQTADIDTRNILIYRQMSDEQVSVEMDVDFPLQKLPSKITIPSEIHEDDVNGTVVKIADGGFYISEAYTCDIELPDTIRTIGMFGFASCVNSAFSMTGKDHFDLSEVTFIGIGAFQNCKGLTEVILPTSMSYRRVENSTFDGCISLEMPSIPENINQFGQYAFSEIRTSIPTLTIPGTVQAMGDGCFSNCTALEKVILPDNIDFVPKKCFMNCTSLTEVTLGNNTNEIAEKAFEGCTSLQEMQLPESVITIDDLAFADCTSMTFISIVGQDVSRLEIGQNSFEFNSLSEDPPIVFFRNLDRDNLELIYERTAGPEVEKYLYWVGDSNTVIKDSSYFYELQFIFSVIGEGIAEITASRAAALEEIVSIPKMMNIDGEDCLIVGIGANVFKDNTDITRVIVPNCLSSIGNAAFSGCTALTAIYMDDSEHFKPISLELNVKSVGENAFNGCTGITDFPVAVETVGENAFSGCTSLSSVDIHAATALADSAFHDCPSLLSVTMNAGTPLSDSIPSAVDTVTSVRLLPGSEAGVICDNVVAGCVALETLNMDSSLTSWDNFLFDGCVSLHELMTRPGQFLYQDDTFSGAHFTTEIFFKDENGNSTSVLVHIPDEDESEADEYFLHAEALSVLRYAMRNTSYKRLTIPKLENPDGTESLRFLASNAISENPSLEEITIEAEDIQKYPDADDYPEDIFSDNSNLTAFSTGLTCAATPRMLDRCQNLENVTFLPSVSKIGTYAFSNTGLKSVTVPNTVLEIETFAFANVRLSAFHSEADLIDYGEDLFITDDLELVQTPCHDSGYEAINLSSVFGTRPTSAIIIGDIPTGSMTLTNIVYLSARTQSVNYGALSGLALLTTVDFEETDSIAFSSFAFKNDSALTSIRIANVNYIGQQCFVGCTALTSICIKGYLPNFIGDTASMGGSADKNKAFDTGGAGPLYLELTDENYKDGWEADLSTKISDTLQNTMPATWQRTGRLPETITIRMAENYVHAEG